MKRKNLLTAVVTLGCIGGLVFFLTTRNRDLSEKTPTPEGGSVQTETPEHPAAEKPSDTKARDVSEEEVAKKPEREAPTKGTQTQNTPTALLPVESCVKVTYHSEQRGSKVDLSQWAKQDHAFTIKHTNYNPKSLCVLVNGSPVQHSINPKNKMEALIGGVAGPNAEVTLRYCVGQTKCNESCNLPKDEFMDALGLNAAPPAKKAKGGKEESVEQEADREIAELKELLIGSQKNNKTYRGWVAEDESPACEKAGQQNRSAKASGLNS